MIRRFALLLSLASVTGCASSVPYATSVGALKPGATMTVRVANAQVMAYKPAMGDPTDRFTIAATALANATPPPPPTIRPAGTGITVDAERPLRNLLVRVPTGVKAVFIGDHATINVTDVDANVDVTTKVGDVTIMVPGYAQAATGKGHIGLTIGATTWPGTLVVRNGDGDTDVWIKATARFNVRMHTDDGTLFTDFGLRGTSQGTAETITGSVNGGSRSAIDIEAKRGIIRLLRLTPQA